jgi:hypothetical protein
MFAGVDKIEQTFIGSTIPITGLTQTFNLATGVNQTVTAAPAYFNFTSSDTDVAFVSENGLVTVIGKGTAKITAILNGVKAAGSLTIESVGEFLKAPAPPARNAADVISVFSDAYTNIPVDFYNGFFAESQTTLGGAIKIGNENIIQYTNLNFVATEFKNPTINISQMTHFHVDIFINESISSGDFISIELGDFGPNNVFGGGDDSSSRLKYASGSLVSNQWISLDIPLTSFDLASSNNLAQIFFISDETVSTILVDNMYFYR